MGRLVDLMHEADHRAGADGRATVGPTDVQHAIDARIRRSSRLYERLQEQIRSSTIRIDVAGVAPGQINALSVVQLGDERFGHPSRVTATVRVGRGELVDIEREVELGGPIHSKGVLILAGFLARRFGKSPLALHASLVFEQAYGLRADGTRVKHYYVKESVGIAVGLLLASLHRAGLASLTHTPSPMGFLRELLGRPENERPYVLVPVGYPADGCTVPDLERKPLDEILIRR